MTQEIIIESKSIPHEDLRRSLEAEVEGAEFQTRILRRDTRDGASQVVLVAAVGAGGSVIGALITSLFQYLNSRNARGKLIVENDGVRIEAPCDLPKEKVNNLIERALAAEKVRILLP